jgi:hypothetical protein
VAVGLAGAALARAARAPRATWVLAGVLTGAFTSLIAAGYLANLAVAATFVAAVALVATGGRRGAAIGAVAIGAGGLAHPCFAGLGLAVLAGAPVPSFRRYRARASTALAATGGGAVLLGAGLLLARIGGPPIEATTSIDAYLRRYDLVEELRRVLRERWRPWRSAAWAVGGLLGAGIRRPRTFAGWFLVAWTAITAGAVGAGLAIGTLPTHRAVSFAVCLPVLAAFAVAWLARRGAAGAVLALVLLAACLATGVRTWTAQRTFVEDDALAQAVAAGRLAATTPAGTPLVFVVDRPETPALFLATSAENLARAAVPPDRIGDVHVVLGRVEDLFAGRPTVRGAEPSDAVAARAFAAIPADREPAVFVLAALNPEQTADPRLEPMAEGVLASLPAGSGGAPAPAQLEPSSPASITGSTLTVLALLTFVGAGWARWATPERLLAWACAPAIGTAITIAVTLAGSLAGVDLDSRGGPIALLALAGGAGWLPALRARRHPTPAPRPS